MARKSRKRHGPCFERRKLGDIDHAYQLAVFAGVPLAVIDALEFMDERGLKRMRIGDLVRVADALQCACMDLVPGLAVSADRFRKKYAPRRPVIPADRPIAPPVAEPGAPPVPEIPAEFAP